MTDQSTVRWSLDTTINLGNFENIKVGVDVETSSKQGENVKELSDRVYNFTESEFNNKVQAIRKQLEEFNG